MPSWTMDWLDNTLQTRAVGEQVGDAITGLSTDTRAITSGQLFLALTGENFDGHDFVQQAIANGAAAVVVSRPMDVTCPQWVVPDTLLALQHLAKAHRQTLAKQGCQVISVSGSNGKTTTRHLIHHVLTACGLRGSQSPKSFNNHIGVPLTLLAAEPTDDFVACEIGTNHPGEVAALAAITQPDIAVLTSLGEEHLEFFKDLQGVAKEECAVVNHVLLQGVLIHGPLQGFEPMLQAACPASLRVQAVASEHLPQIAHLPGEHQKINAALALAVGRVLGLEASAMLATLPDVQAAPHRGQVMQLGQGVMLIDDCYNANPSSMQAAITTLATLAKDSRSVLVMGDMFELGDLAQAAHQQVYDQAIAQGIDRILTVGQQACQASGNMDFAQWCPTLPDQLAQELQPGDIILLKASRGMRLERLIPAIQNKFDAIASHTHTS